MLKLIIFATVITYTYATVTGGIAVLKTDTINGQIKFTKTDAGIKVEGTINGLPAGKHGFHIHDKGDLSNGCASAAGHFNPTKKEHGAPSDENRHVGDLGNIVANDKNVATIDIVDKLIALEGTNSIIGRAVVVHENEDDLGKGGFADSKTTGHAGSRLACAVIGILDESTNAGMSFTIATTTLTLLLPLIVPILNM